TPQKRSTPRLTQKSQKQLSKAKGKEVHLHTPRSGQFLEFLAKRLLRDSQSPIKKEGSGISEQILTTTGTEVNEIDQRPTEQNSGPWDDSGDDTEAWFVKDADIEIVGTRRERQMKKGKN